MLGRLFRDAVILGIRPHLTAKIKILHIISLLDKRKKCQYIRLDFLLWIIINSVNEFCWHLLYLVPKT